MRRKLLFFMPILVLLGVILPVSAQESSDLLARLNNLRASNGLPGFTINGALAAAAQQQAQWMVDNGTISHTRPDGSGPRTRALAAGYGSTMVGENIYGGTNATANDAWTFWINSAIHFNSMISPNFQEVGIGIASGGWGAAYVLVFGGSGAPPPVAAAIGASGAQQSAPAGPPAYVGGADEYGNIKHIVQPGDTLGDIALIYGYTWGDLPYMMQLNGLTDVRDLEIGSIFLVPPKAGTYTPTPDTRPPTETPVPTDLPPTITPFVLPTATVELVPTLAIATAGANVAPPGLENTVAPLPSPTAGEVVQVAALATPGEVRPVTAVVQPRSSSTNWIMIAVGVQVVVLIGAGIEFLRRAIRKRR